MTDRLPNIVYDKEPFEREREDVNRPDPADRLINEKKDEDLETITFTNEQLTEIVTKIKEVQSLLVVNAKADDKLIADLELRVRALERQGRMSR